MIKHAALAVLLGTTALSPAWAASTINTTLPVNGVPYNAAPIRQNFGAASSDISALQSMNAGPSAPSAPSSGTLWLKTPNSGTTYTLHVWISASHAWVPIASIDAAAGIWMPPTGGGALPSLVSAATTDLGSVPQTALYITGAQTIASFGASAPVGVMKVLIFTGNATLHNNNTSLILPGGVDMRPAPGAVVTAVSLGSGNWRVAGDVPAAVLPIDICLQAGMTCNGSTNDATALQAFLNTLPRGSTASIAPGKTTYLAGTVTLPANITFDCGMSPGTTGNTGGATPAVFTNLGGISLANTGTFVPGPSATIKNCPIIKSGLTFPVANASGYTGTAITFAAFTADVRLENLLMVGFNTCVNQAGQADRYYFDHLECDAVNGFVLGPSFDTSEIHAVRTWPWGTAIGPPAPPPGDPVNLRSGTGMLFTGTNRVDDLKVFGYSDYGHTTGLDVENAGGNCCNIYFDQVWLDTNGTTGAAIKTVVSFGRLWLWSSGIHGVVADGNFQLHVNHLSINNITGGAAIQLLNAASLIYNQLETSESTGHLIDASTSSASLIQGGNLYVNPSNPPATPYFVMSTLPVMGSATVSATSVNMPVAVSNLLGTSSLLPLQGFGDVVTATTGIPAPTVTIAGPGQTTAALADAGLFGGSLLLKSAGNTAGDGGALLFGENTGHMRHFAAIKGLSVDGAGGTLGNLAISLRASTSDSALTEALLISAVGTVQMAMTDVAAHQSGTCTAGTAGTLQVIRDVLTNTGWGKTYTGGGSVVALTFCDGTQWTLMAAFSP